MQPFSGTENASFIISNGSRGDAQKFCRKLAESFNVSFIYEARNRRCTLRRKSIEDYFDFIRKKLI